MRIDLRKPWPRLAPTLLLALIAGGSPGAAAERARIDLNGTWQFRLDPRNEGEAKSWYAANTSFADSIQVPGCWQAQGFGERAGILRNHYVGNAWYRRLVAVPADWKDKVVSLRFGGVTRRATVFINGVKIGEHDGFSAPFEFDITRAVRLGTHNVVAVRVNNPGPAILESPDKQTPTEPAGMFNYIGNWGGIHGGVDLQAKGRSWIGDFYISSQLQSRSVKFKVTVESREAENPSQADLTVVISSGPNRRTYSQTVHFRIAPGQTMANVEVPMADAVSDLQLWSPVATLEIVGPDSGDSGKIDLVIELNSGGARYANRWSFWVFAKSSLMKSAETSVASSIKWDGLSRLYPFIKPASPTRDTGLLLTSSLNTDALRFLERGGRVLLLTDRNLSERSSETTFFPASGGALGTVVAEHPLFKRFPNEGFCDLQFYNLLEGAQSYSLDSWPKQLVPIVGGIRTTTGFLSKTKNLSRVGYVFEARVGKGKPLVSTLRIRENFDEAFPEVVAVFDELLRYAVSQEFEPRFEVAKEQLRRLVVE